MDGKCPGPREMENLRQGGSLEKAFKEYEQQWHINCFESIRTWLCENSPDTKIQLDVLGDPNRFLALMAAVVDQVATAHDPANFGWCLDIIIKFSTDAGPRLFLRDNIDSN